MLAGLAIAATALAAWALIAPDRAAPRTPIALFTSLPLLWAEAPDVATMLRPEGAMHWARAALERGHDLVPLDSLETLGTRSPPLLLMAQPRPLSPQENVALDAWVRDGGRVLLFADPALTQDSAFALGDKRRPQDTVLLSPILTRWGLRLTFDEDQPLGERTIVIAARRLPLNLPGRRVAVPGGACRSGADGAMARCRIGEGAVTVIADAALFERQEQEETVAPRRDVLLALVEQASR